MASSRGFSRSILLTIVMTMGISVDNVHSYNGNIPQRVAAIDEVCNVSDLCPSDASCDSGTCKCYDGFVPDSQKKVCLKVADKWEDECRETAQCETFEGAICSNNICVCPPNQHFVGAQCYTTRKLHEECKSDNECFLTPHANRVECKDGVCRCKSQYSENEMGDDCSGGSTLWSLGFISLLLTVSIQQLMY